MILRQRETETMNTENNCEEVGDKHRALSMTVRKETQSTDHKGEREGDMKH